MASPRLPPVWFIFVCRYTDSWKQFHRYLPWLYVISFLTVGLVWTNEFHHWVWLSTSLNELTQIVVYEQGLWFRVVHVPYNYAILAFTLFVLGRAMWNAQRAQRGQMYVLIAVQVLPILSNLIYLAKLYPVDLTPIGFSLSAGVLAFGLSRHRLLEQLPIAYRSVFSHMQDGVMVLSKDWHLLEYNPAARRLLALHETQVQRPLLEVWPELQQVIRELKERNHADYREDNRSLDLDLMTIAREDEVQGYILTLRDVTERDKLLDETKRMQEQILEGALLYDALTNLPNRFLFLDRLQQALKRRERSGEELIVMFLDLDRFKTVNDTLGHNAGDQLLTETSRRLQSCVRNGDTVARFGGDEFAVLLENISEDGASQLAERIQKTLQLPLKIEGREVFSSASIGLTSSRDLSDPEQLLRNADLAMYQAKAEGKARSRLFDTQLHAKVMDTMQLEIDLRKAFERSEFRVHYQPIMDMTTLEISGFEALVRWQHPIRQLVAPGVFIPVAEELGLITELDQWVLKEACKQLALWQKNYPRKLTMSVNLSTKNFLQKDLPQRLADIIKESGISPDQLKLEITESVLMENAEAGAQLLTQLRAQGIRLQIDDFGTGYSSLSYLHSLPLDSLKIDRSFIQQLSSEGKLEIVKTIMSLARSLHLDVVAEGIETEEQLLHLQELMCDYGQGFLFSKPIPPEQIELSSYPKTSNPTISIKQMGGL